MKCLLFSDLILKGDIDTAGYALSLQMQKAR